MAKRKLTLLLLAFPILLHGQEFGDAIEQSRKEVQSILSEYPGVSVAVGYCTKIAWEEGFGFANAATKTGVQSENRFMYYSLSKSIVGLAIYQLVEAGAIDLDKAVTAYDTTLPAHYNKITVRMLLNHSAGVRHYNKGEWLKISMNITCLCNIDKFSKFHR